MNSRPSMVFTGLLILAACPLPRLLAAQDAATETQTTAAPVQDPAASTEDRPTVVLIVGAAGAQEYGDAFQSWAERWQQVAAGGDADFHWIGPRSIPPNPPAASQENNSPTAPPETPDRELLQSTLETACRRNTTQPLWLIYIGHGSFDQQTAALNLRGPDLSAAELATMLKPASRPLVVAICASSSAPFINALSGPGRVIISATKDGNQVQYSRFGDALSTAMSGLEADADRDGQTSLLEAWLFAARRTAEFYAAEGRLATEHSLLDDNGDGRGVRAELFDGLKPAGNIQSDQPIDGSHAARIWLVRSPDERLLTADQQVTRDALEARLEALRLRRSELDEADYLQQLEQILLPLARLYQEAEQRRAQEPAAP